MRRAGEISWTVLDWVGQRMKNALVKPVAVASAAPPRTPGPGSVSKTISKLQVPHGEDIYQYRPNNPSGPPPLPPPQSSVGKTLFISNVRASEGSAGGERRPRHAPPPGSSVSKTIITSKLPVPQESELQRGKPQQPQRQLAVRPNEHYWKEWHKRREEIILDTSTYTFYRTKFVHFIRKFAPAAFPEKPSSKYLVTDMEKIENVVVGPMPASDFLKPMRMTFTQNGSKRLWDFMKLHESVSCIIFNKSRNVLVLVKQFRPPVYFGSIPAAMKVPKMIPDPKTKQPVVDIDWTKFPPANGITLEMCAGLVDKPGKSTAEIVKEEVMEECGYDVPLSSFEYVSCFVYGVGVSGETQTMYYAEVTDDMKAGKGGGNPAEGEFIDVVELTVPELKTYVKQACVKSPSSFLFGMMWFLANKT